MKALHLINKKKSVGRGYEHLSKSEAEENVWFSGFWDIPLAEAESLVGGELYLHETKAKPSHNGGRVLSVLPEVRENLARTNRVVFKIRAFSGVKGVKWRGAKHAMASYGGIIEVDG